MDKTRTPEEALELIDYLVSKGKRPNSFENAFPRIQQFKGVKGSLQAHISSLEGPDAEKACLRKNTQNVIGRMELVKSYVDEFQTANPNWVGINEFKYQAFADRAVEQIPF